jgi:hypothetical protein
MGGMKRLFTCSLAVLAAALATAAPAGAATVVHTWHANLDGDAHRELVQLVKNGTTPTGHRWVRVVDRVGGQTVTARISPRVEFMTASDVKVEDMNARPGRDEVYYFGNIGGTAGSPTYAGIRGWSGTQVHRFWTYAPPYPKLRHDGHTYSYDSVTINLAQIASAHDPGLEINLRQGEITGGAPLCCPQFELIRHYRYQPATSTWVLYEQRWQRN